ncbi:ABC transporter substrate-binding protein [Streptomyces reniochalinae]|uniref:Sulfate ABC transporter substrate-binding protein n=1 Tax=Streptomyces reniochalinae TaxID=2250578 RepID=A0A367EDP6_9ACTN|nr:ABC transporter substrate-binding protein [Streptomyces reniochalinae]RCG15879.1 sulfate ABC transporter substrate-binding protein [Streptomyces reniochalinae]
MPRIRALPPRPSRRTPAALAALWALLLAAGCGYGSKAVVSGDPAPAGGEKIDGLDEVKLGYFPNVTHATPLVGLRSGGPIPRELGGTKVSTQVFDAGPSAIEALNAKAVDMTWVGPSSAVNGWVQSGGKNLRIVSGATSGGASLVVDPEKVASPDDLRGKTLATPQLGNTQDVALLHHLRSKGIDVDPETGRGATSVLRQDNKEIPTTFRQGGIDGAWVPEPTASRLVAEGGKVLLDEEKLWKEGKFVTTNLVVRKDFLDEHPDAVEAVLRGSVRTNAWIRSHPGTAKKYVNDALRRDAGKPLPRDVLDAAFRRIEVTDDPLAATLRKQAEHADAAGLLETPQLAGVYDLAPLNRVLRSEGRPAVTDAGLGRP